MGKVQHAVVTRAELAAAVQAQLYGDAGGGLTGVNTVELAGPGDVTFVTSKAHADGAAASKAGAVIVPQKLQGVNVPQLVVVNVDIALIETLRLFAPRLTPISGVHPAAVVADTASIASDAAVGPGAYVGPGAQIGSCSVIGPGCMVGENTTIGSHCRLDPNVVVYHNCRIGNYCIIQANTTIGSTGFGYTFVDGQHRLIPHNGGVIIEDCVEIGANCCIDRAKFNDTIIGAGSKLDNLIQIGHNVVVGKCCIFAGQVGISGSCTIGDGVMLAGQVGVADHIQIGEGAQVGAQAGVMKDVESKLTIVGSPAQDAMQFMRTRAVMGRLPEWGRELRALAGKVEKLEKRLAAGDEAP
jgi:UDP-3-O-[3-hydroxymyristoyl] glucosamine N-acyltransferase